MKNILILGSGGRESAFAWKISQSDFCKSLFIAPGNAGTDKYGKNVNLDINDFQELKTFCLNNQIDIVLPGSEELLVKGVVDFFENDPELNKILMVGPKKLAAQLEGSKAFAKKFMINNDIPTANYQEFDERNFEDGLKYIENHDLPIVLKADGLAAGKGVVITENREEAKSIFTAMIKEKQFGDASKKVVIEQFLSGIELSVFILTDGAHYVLLPEAKDYKRIGEGETGLNTGGMGAVSPVPFADKAFMEKVKTQIIEPTIAGLKKEDIDYRGFLFFGLIEVGGNPYVIEYNCRMGDPETEVVLPRMENDLLDLFEKMQSKTLHQIQAKISDQTAVTIMMVSGGYPGSYEKGKTINQLDQVENSLVFHAGTSKMDGKINTAGGRVLAITSFGTDLKEALEISYKNAGIIDFEGKYFRKDIGFEFL